MGIRECKISASVCLTASHVHCFDIADSTSKDRRVYWSGGQAQHIIFLDNRGTGVIRFNL